MKVRETSAWTVELLGLPGVGKSTALRNLLTTNTDIKVLKSSVRPNTNSSSLRFAFIKLIVALAVKAPASCSRLVLSRNGRWLLAKVAYRLSIVGSIGELNKTVILQDSGTLQPFVSLLAEERNDRKMRRSDLVALLKVMPFPKQVLVFDDSEVEILSRYFERSRSDGPRVGIKVTFCRYSDARSFMLQDMAPLLRERGAQVHVLCGLDSFQDFDRYLKESYL